MQAFPDGKTPPDPASVLGDLIRSGEAGRLREAAGISQATMAGGLGIARMTLCRVENRQQRPGRFLAGRWLRVLRGLANHEAVTKELAAAWRRGAA
ncbi:MAG TPA: helix-turn-helix transcriptional regulator [Streptosporangiaceae bacterium]|nr:helix-turn-helix transcriptional regulator [Streptosporangiaceae bacterium]